MDVDNEELIANVFKRSVLWDVTDKYFKDRKVSAAAWDEVCRELQISDRTFIKKKWKGLKDYYRNELLKIQNSKFKTLSENKRISSWPYFELMGFIKNTFGIRNRPCSLTASSEPEPEEIVEIITSEKDIIQENSTNSATSLESDFPLSQNVTTTTTSLQIPYKAVKRKCSYNDQFREASAQNDLKKPDSLQQSTIEDDDMHFFLSLLPDIKSLPRKEKLLLRMNIQQLVYNAVTSNESTAGPNASSSVKQKSS